MRVTRPQKGLYKKARSGQLPNMTGIDSPYEAPVASSLIVDGVKTDVATAIEMLLAFVKD
jgi:bifunctional enzyme CysN/CysC